MRETSSAAGADFDVHSSTLGSDQTDRLAMTPLFQVHASGWPFMAHKRIGLSCFWASITPSQNVGSQSTVSKDSSSDLGRMRSRHCANVSSFNSAGGWLA